MKRYVCRNRDYYWGSIQSEPTLAESRTGRHSIGCTSWYVLVRPIRKRLKHISDRRTQRIKKSPISGKKGKESISELGKKINSMNTFHFNIGQVLQKFTALLGTKLFRTYEPPNSGKNCFYNMYICWDFYLKNRLTIVSTEILISYRNNDVTLIHIT